MAVIAKVFNRKHGKNVIGAKGFYGRENLNRLMNIKLLEKELAGTIKQFTALKERLEVKGFREHQPELNAYLELARTGGLKAAIMMKRSGIRKNSILRNLLLYLLLLKADILLN